jgi:ubiquinone/menaquinone biosynthesis C-methylase UbiE
MTPQQLAYLQQRRRQIRYWPFMAVALLALLTMAYVYLYRQFPFYVSPQAFVDFMQAKKIDESHLQILAALGALAGMGAGLFMVALIALASAALWNERRLILMLEELLATAASGTVAVESENTGFKDYFSALATDYANYRPHYPASFFAELAKAAPGHERAWDCATGNGQAAEGLAPYFTEVVATDASAQQIAAAEAMTQPVNVQFAVAPANASGLPDASVDVLLVAQAAHWFDLPGFYAEAERVLRPGGVLALLTYSGVCTQNEGLDVLLCEFYQVTVGPYWPPERAHVENDYRDLPFPWPEISFPAQTMTAQWSLDQLMGYLGTWSATSRYREQRGHDPLPALRASLEPLWGDVGSVRELSWALPVRIGRRP